MENEIRVKRIGNHYLNTPKQESAFSAGYDLSAVDSTLIESGGIQLIKTGFAWAIPEGYVGIIKPRSGLASKHGIDVMAGVIDSDYRGEIMVLLVNRTPIFMDKPPVTLILGERIAQMIIIPVLHLDVVENTIDETERGDGGFGSTGK